MCGGFLAGCATSVLPPGELIDARQAYYHASVGQAAQLARGELQKAQEALAIAERSFEMDPKSFHTRDLAYVADRKAKIAEAVAASVAQNSATDKTNEDLHTTQTEIRKNAKTGNKSPEMHRILAKLAAVKEEPRGLVVSLSDSILFVSNTAALLRAAQNQLNRIVAALMATKDRNLTVECHTGARRSSSREQELSQQRADAVRSYIISRGYPGALIQAHGIDGPVSVAAHSGTRDRAGNPRVEIIIAR